MLCDSVILACCRIFEYHRPCRRDRADIVDITGGLNWGIRFCDGWDLDGFDFERRADFGEDTKILIGTVIQAVSRKPLSGISTTTRRYFSGRMFS